MRFGPGRFIPASVKFRARRKFRNLLFRAHTFLGRSKYLLAIYRLFGVNQALVVARLNTRFDCGFSTPGDMPAYDAEVKERLRRHHEYYGGGARQSYLPNEEKQLAKNQVDFSSQQPQLDRCERLYRRYLAGREKSH